MPEKVVKPFWTKECKNLSNRIWLPNYINYDEQKYIQCSNTISYSFVPITNNTNVCVPSITPYKQTKPSSLKIKIRFFPTKEQKMFFQKCFGTHRYFYNKTIHTILNTYEVPHIKQVMLSDKKAKNTAYEWQTYIPYKTRYYAIKEAISSNLKYIKKDYLKQEFIVSSKDVKKGWNLFGKYKLRFKNRDFKKLLNETPKTNLKIICEYGAYYILVDKPYRKEKNNNNHKHHIISLDPGVKCFQTGFCPSGHVIKIGEKQKEAVLKHYDKIDTLNNIINNIDNKRTKYNLYKRIRKIDKKINNIIYDLHNQVATQLAKEYKHIMLPEFGKQRAPYKIKLYSKVKRMMETLGFNKFQKKLALACYKHNSKIYFVTEEYTSKTCTCCGEINNDLGGLREFNCTQCGLILDRDINGARNILIKNLL